MIECVCSRKETGDELMFWLDEDDEKRIQDNVIKKVVRI